jgi:hypothetical protein
MDQDEIEMLRLLKAELESKKCLLPPPDTHMAVMKGLHGHLKKIADAFGVNGACYDDMVKKIVAKAGTTKSSRTVGLVAVRRAVADLMRYGGCGCCRNHDAHDKAVKRLGKLLKVPMYDDKSGYDFGKFQSEK